MSPVDSIFTQGNFSHFFVCSCNWLSRTVCTSAIAISWYLCHFYKHRSVFLLALSVFQFCLLFFSLLFCVPLFNVAQRCIAFHSIVCGHFLVMTNQTPYTCAHVYMWKKSKTKVVLILK